MDTPGREPATHHTEGSTERHSIVVTEPRFGTQPVKGGYARRRGASVGVAHGLAVEDFLFDVDPTAPREQRPDLQMPVLRFRGQSHGRTFTDRRFIPAETRDAPPELVTVQVHDPGPKHPYPYGHASSETSPAPAAAPIRTPLV